MPPIPGIGAEPDADVDTASVQAFMRAMREEEFDLAFQLYGGGRYSNPFIKRLGARLTIGLKAADAEPLDRWLPYGQPQNKRLQFLEVAALAGADTLRLGRELQVTDCDRREAAGVLRLIQPKPLIVLQPGASDARRRWSAQRYAAVADALAQEGALIAVNGTGDEAALVREVIGRMDHAALDLAGKLSLPGLCGLLERASLLLSNDTGPLHLALAIGTPCVGIYWLMNLYESAPLRQERHRAALSVRVHCPVCGAENLATRCPHDVSFVGEVTVEEVTALALELLRHAS
jgi:ADP-heptose:LPS heptosyltransferase